MSQSANAMIGWGVSLHDDSEYGDGNHPSLRDDDGDETVDMYEILSKDSYKNVLEYAWAGCFDYEHYSIIFFKRGYQYITYRHANIPDPKRSVLALGPTWTERNVMDDFLTEIGFTGDRTVTLILAASYG